MIPRRIPREPVLPQERGWREEKKNRRLGVSYREKTGAALSPISSHGVFNPTLFILCILIPADFDSKCFLPSITCTTRIHATPRSIIEHRLCASYALPGNLTMSSRPGRQVSSDGLRETANRNTYPWHDGDPCLGRFYISNARDTILQFLSLSTSPITSSNESTT